MKRTIISALLHLINDKEVKTKLFTKGNQRADVGWSDRMGVRRFGNG